MANTLSLAALACVVIASVAFAQPIEESYLSSAEIAKKLNESDLSPVDTLGLLERQDPLAIQAIYKGYDAPDFVSFADFDSHDCGEELLSGRTKFYEAFKKLDDNTQIFVNLNRFCDITLEYIEYTCDEHKRSNRLSTDLDGEAMWFKAEVERYLASHQIEASKLISGEAGDVMARMYPNRKFGGAAKRDYCLKLIKQVDSLSAHTNVPPQRYQLAYQACKQWRAVQRAVLPVASE